MAIQWTAALQGIVSRVVFNRGYADLRAEEAALLDDSNSSAVPTSTPGGIAGEALTYLTQYAQWFEEAGASAANAPSAWSVVYSAEVSYRLAEAFKSETSFGISKLRSLAASRARAWDSAIESYSKADASAVALNDLTITPKVCRLHVVRHCVRRRPRVFIPVSVIDVTMKAMWAELWNAAGWEIRTRQALLTMATASEGSAPTITLPAGESIDALASPRLWYNDTECPGQAIEMVDGDRMAQLKALNAGETGRPEFFSLEARGGSTLYWHFEPQPDSAYTARIECQVTTPADPADASAVTLFAKLQTELVALLPQMTLHKVLMDAPQVNVIDRRDAERKYTETIEMIHSRYTRVAEVESTSPRDVYGYGMRSGRYPGGGL